MPLSRFLRLKYWTLFVVQLVVASCTAESNFMGKLALGESKKSPEYLLAQAELAFNAQNFKLAIALAERAAAIDGGSETGAIILAYSYLGLSGLDPFSLATKIMEKEDAKKEGEASQGTGTGSTTEPSAPSENSASALWLKRVIAGNQLEGESETTTTDSSASTDSGSSSSSSTDPLSSLSEILGYTDDDVVHMTLDNNSLVLEDGSVLEGAPSSGVFKDYPILLPKTAVDARAAGGDVIQNINLAIHSLCPFVDDEVKVLGEIPDPRHASDQCPDSHTILRQGGKLYFVWAFAHLSEAIAFKKVVLYDPSGKGPNLTRRSDALGDPQSVGIVEYVQGIKQLASVMDVVFPTDSQQSQVSMLSGMLNDLTATSKGFAMLPGIPASLTKSIDETLNKLEAQKAKIKEASAKSESQVSESEASNNALKETLTGELGEKIQAQILEKLDAGELTTEQKSNVCTAYSQISSTVLDVCSQ